MLWHTYIGEALTRFKSARLAVNSPASFCTRSDPHALHTTLAYTSWVGVDQQGF
jgi:hypothetical protein